MYYEQEKSVKDFCYNTRLKIPSEAAQRTENTRGRPAAVRNQQMTMETFLAVKDICLCLLKGWWFRFRRWVCGRAPSDVHSVSDSLDPTQITYSQVWEDTETLKQALNIQEGECVLCIASGGDNALSLLLDEPKEVVAVDFSPAQIAVASLKKYAIKYLTYEEFACLVGLGPSEVQGDSRVTIYLKKLRPHLPDLMVDFWDEKLDIIHNGLIYEGIYEKYFKIFANVVRPIAHGEATIRKLLSLTSIEDQRKYYDEVIDTFLWRLCCRLYFGDVLLGRCPAFYERSDTNIGDHFHSRIRHIIRNVPVHNNFYLEYILTGTISGQNGLPDYLDEKNFNKLKQRVDRLRLVQGDVIQYLNNGRAYECIDLSNIFDFIPCSAHDTYKNVVLTHATLGARICHWTFVPMKHPVLTRLGDESEIDEKLSHHLNNIERAWFYQTFTVQKLNKIRPKHPAGYKNGVVKHIANGYHH